MDFQLPILAPSILAADYTRLGDQIRHCTDAGASWIHCDIMDGHFVPNISFGPGVVKAVNHMDDTFIDVHLMIENPDRFIESFADAGANQITVHQETCLHLHRSVQHIKQYGIMAGVAINPATSLQAVRPILEYADLLLIMSVNPGFGGQSFIESTYGRLREACLLRDELGLDFLIEVDGGIDLENIEQVTRAGADVIVSGSSVFKAKNIPKRIEELTKRARMGKGLMV